MPKKKLKGQTEAFHKAAKSRAKRKNDKYVLRLFVAGVTPRSERAIRSVKEVCEQYLQDRYELEIVDIYQQTDGVLSKEQIVVAPTLIKKLPLPLRRMIGDMSAKEKILLGLDLKKKT